jgi:hypothetical protein
MATHVWGQESAAQGEGTAVPRLIRFSGTLRPEGEKPARGVVELSFSLFKEEAGGEPLWFESQTVEVDAQGRARSSRPVLRATKKLAEPPRGEKSPTGAAAKAPEMQSR